MSVTNRMLAEHYVWGKACDGWRLLDGNDLSVIEERMPPRAKETLHFHEKANQLFYVLEGALTIDVDNTITELNAGDALNVRPGQLHQAINQSNDIVRFLVISAPNTKRDRHIKNAPPT